MIHFTGMYLAYRGGGGAKECELEKCEGTNCESLLPTHFSLLMGEGPPIGCQHYYAAK